MSTLVYHLAKNQEYQHIAREEVLKAMGPHGEPSLDNLKDMPFLHACFKEALRINSPAVRVQCSSVVVRFLC
jgi:cytochrome P450